MNKNQKRVQILSLVGIFMVCFLLSQTPVFAKSSFDIGMIGVGARAIGMGKAYVAVVDDTNALFVNPAGLAVQDEWSATCMSTKLMNKVDYKLLGGAYKTDYGTFGVGYISANTPGGYLNTDKPTLSTATPISYGSSQLSLSYARSLDGIVKGYALGSLSVGVNLKLLRNDFSGFDASANGTGIDVGLLLSPKSDLSFGACIKNLSGGVRWENGSDENLEGETKLGGAVKLMDGKLLLAMDADFYSGPMLFHGGAEYEINRFLALRAGFDQDAVDADNTETNLTAGIGFNMSGVSFDYAYRQDNQLAENSTHYFSISFKPEFASSFVSNKQDNKIASTADETETEAETEAVSEVKTVKAAETETVDSSKGILDYYK